MKESTKFHTTRMNLDIFSDPSSMNLLTTTVKEYLDSINDDKFIFIKTNVITGNSFPLHIAVIQLECDPPKILGIILLNYIFQIYVKSESLVKKFNGIVIQLLSLLQDCYLFCFSNQAIRFIKQILPHKANELQYKPSVDFIKDLKIINVQRRNDEELFPALISIGKRPYNEALLNDNYEANIYFKQKYFNHILEHNTSYLLSILKLVKTRYLKLMIW